MADNESEAAEVQPPPEQSAEETTVTSEETTATTEETAVTTEEATVTTQDETKAETEPSEQQDGESGEEGDRQAAAEATEAPAEADSDADQKPADAEGESQAEVIPAEPSAEGETVQKGPEEETTEEAQLQVEAEKTEGEAETQEAEGGVPAEGEVKEEEKGEDKHEGEGGEGLVASTEEAKEGKEEEGGTKSPLPQSDGFTEGERPEIGGVQVGEKLSREATPISEARLEEPPERLEAGTPERPEEEESEHKDQIEEQMLELEATTEEEEPPLYDRDALIERYHMALAERENLLQQNYQLQNKLAEYFRKKKNDERPDYDKNVADQEQRYLKYMAQLDELHTQDNRERETYQHHIEEMRNRCEEKREKVDDEVNHFTEFKKQVAINAMNSRSGKPIAPKDIEQYLVTSNKKEQEVVHVRLENIKLKNKLKKKELHLKSKEELAEGLHLIDFEQLKIENQTYNEKIEERNEELLKLRKKITSTVQVLTHLKEKLQFVQGENQIQRGKLQEVEALVGQKRDVLSRTKQARDSLRIDNNRLRQNCGLLGNEALLRDFEERKDESDDLSAQLDRLRMQHAELTLACNQVRRKIDQSRIVRQ